MITEFYMKVVFHAFVALFLDYWAVLAAAALTLRHPSIERLRFAFASPLISCAWTDRAVTEATEKANTAVNNLFILPAQSIKY